MENQKETFTMTTSTENILNFAEEILFNEKSTSSEDVLGETLTALYGTLVVFHIAGYDKEELKGLLSESVETSFPFLKEVRDLFRESQKRAMN